MNLEDLRVLQGVGPVTGTGPLHLRGVEGRTGSRLLSSSLDLSRLYPQIRDQDYIDPSVTESV